MLQLIANLFRASIDDASRAPLRILTALVLVRSHVIPIKPTELLWIYTGATNNRFDLPYISLAWFNELILTHFSMQAT